MCYHNHLQRTYKMCTLCTMYVHVMHGVELSDLSLKTNIRICSVATETRMNVMNCLVLPIKQLLCEQVPCAVLSLYDIVLRPHLPL